MAVLGFADVPARGTVYRVFSLQTRSQVIQVAQDMRVRRTLARDAAWQSLLPIALLAPVLALAVWWVVRSSLAPVQRVRRELATRRPQDRSEEHTSELQSPCNIVCRLLLEKKTAMPLDADRK